LVSLSLTTKSYLEVSSTLHQLAHGVSGGKYLIFGGGGYKPSNVSRCWALMFMTVAGVTSKVKLYKELFDKDTAAQNPTVRRKVRESIRQVKETVFPLHGL